VVIPEFRRLGADEFIVSQVQAPAPSQSLLSIVSFTRRGLYERQMARAACDAAVAALHEAAAHLPSSVVLASADAASSDTPRPQSNAALEGEEELAQQLRRVVRARLGADVSARIAQDSTSREA
jgi:hypothetical protein